MHLYFYKVQGKAARVFPVDWLQTPAFPAMHVFFVVFWVDLLLLAISHHASILRVYHVTITLCEVMAPQNKWD